MAEKARAALARGGADAVACCEDIANSAERSRTAPAPQAAKAPPPWGFGRHAARLAALGYEPVPIRPYQKAPALPQWQEGCPPERWREFAGCGVGLLTRGLPTIDIDTLDQAIGDAIQELVDQHVGDAPIRYGMAPKRAMPCRLAGARFGKLKVIWKPIAGTGDECRAQPPGCEILAHGQQFVALGVHPETRRPYRWERDPDLEIPRALLPPLSEATARRFVDVVAQFITEIGGELIGPRPPEPAVSSARPRWRPDTPEPERISEALDRIGNPDLDYDAWVRVGHAIKAALGEAGSGLWRDWSAKSSKNDPAVTSAKWATFRPRKTGADAIGAGSIFYICKGTRR